MKIEHYNGSDERRILTGMIVDPVVLGKIAAKWSRDGMFGSRWANLIGSWCADYFRKYEAAPKAQIEAVFGSWASAAQRDKSEVQLIDRFLSGLSDEHERLASELNSDYVVDLAGRHFRSVALAKLAEDIRGDLELGDPEQAAGRVAGFGRIELGTGSLVDVLRDEAVIGAVFEEASDPPLVEWPGAAGEFFGRSMERDAFVAFLGPEKRGKTFWLIETAWRAMLQGRRVLFLECGDMSERQIMRRFMVRAARRPFRAGKVLKPTSISRGDDGVIQVEHEETVFEQDMSRREALVAAERIVRGKTEARLRLSTHPVSSLSVVGIKAMLRDAAHDGWVPDAVIIDYADLLDMGDWSREKRHLIDRVWGSLRGLSQEFHCCVVTATQADAASYAKAVLTMENFSDAKTKNAHATGIVGINQTKDERSVGAARLNWVALRENDRGYTEYTCVAVAECRALARVCVLSCW